MPQTQIVLFVVRRSGGSCRLDSVAGAGRPSAKTVACCVASTQHARHALHTLHTQAGAESNNCYSTRSSDASPAGYRALYTEYLTPSTLLCVSRELVTVRLITPASGGPATRDLLPGEESSPAMITLLCSLPRSLPISAGGSASYMTWSRAQDRACKTAGASRAFQQ